MYLHVIHVIRKPCNQRTSYFGCYRYIKFFKSYKFAQMLSKIMWCLKLVFRSMQCNLLIWLLIDVSNMCQPWCYLDKQMHSSHAEYTNENFTAIMANSILEQTMSILYEYVYFIVAVMILKRCLWLGCFKIFQNIM